jgi:hypothetical protein
MSWNSAGKLQIADCPRCGAYVGEPESGRCGCCGSALAPRLSRPPALAAVQAPARDGFAAVRAHGQYQLWMQDAPAGLSFVLGVALTIGVGLVFAIAALSGSLHSRHGQDHLLVPLFVCVGAGIDAWGVWRLVRFYQAPLLHRVARVAAERERTYRTRNGWRTRHYATFEFEDSTRTEFPVSSALAEQVARDDAGVLITRDSVLLAFHRA